MAKTARTKWTGAGRPRWLADETSRDHLVPGGVKLDSAAFPVEDAVTVTTPGGAAIGAVAIPVTGLSGPIPSGTILNFTGVGEFALLTAPATAGATSLTVEALDAAIEAGDTATYPGLGKKFVPSGTLLGQMQAEMDAGAAWGPIADGDDHVRVLRFSIENLLENNDGVLVRPFGTVLKYNLLPQAPLSAARLTQLRTAGYVLQRGVR